MKNIIDFEFSKPGETPDGIAKISLHGTIPERYLPIRFMIYNIANSAVWSSDLYPNMFSLYYEIAYKRIEVTTADGNKLFQWNWNTFEHGDICHQLFYLWSLENRGSKGMAIGAHDGTCGEWVGPVMEGILNAVLVEPSEKQLAMLNHIYSKKKWVQIEQNLVTPDGSDVLFYEGGEGHANSVNKEHVLKYTSEIKEVRMSSTTLTELARRHGISGKWWLHIDAEDLDDKLIISLEDSFLPSCIIFEHEQLGEDRISAMNEWLYERGYETNSSHRNTICIRKDSN